MSAELSFDTDGSGNAKILTGNDAVSMQILNLVTMHKNTDPLNPDKGCDINSYQQSVDDGLATSDLRNTINEQLQTYTSFIPTDVAVLTKSNTIITGIVLQGSTDVICLASEGKRTSLDILKDY